jgi:hypothetical protein
MLSKAASPSPSCLTHSEPPYSPRHPASFSSSSSSPSSSPSNPPPSSSSFSSSPSFMNWGNERNHGIQVNEFQNDIGDIPIINSTKENSPHPNSQFFQFPSLTFDIFGCHHSINTFLTLAAPHYDFEPSIKITTPPIIPPTVEERRQILMNKQSLQTDQLPDSNPTSNRFQHSLLSDLSPNSSSNLEPDEDDPDETCQGVVT